MRRTLAGRCDAVLNAAVVLALSLEDKDFLPSCEKAGKFHLIGKLSEAAPLCVAEDYATAPSIHQATGCPVAVAFDAGNLAAVALALRQANRAARLIVCADDDHLSEGNPGRTKAEAAALAVAGEVALPVFGADRDDKATDFNDLANSGREGEGLDAVRHILNAANAAACAPSGDVSGEAKATTLTAPDDAQAGAARAAHGTEKPAAKTTKRARTKTPGGAEESPSQGGEEFELRDGVQSPAVVAPTRAPLY